MSSGVFDFSKNIYNFAPALSDMVIDYKFIE